MEQGELPKAVNGYRKDLEPPLPKADEKDVESPQTGDDKTEVCESPLAKNDDKEETGMEQPSVAEKDELDDVEPPLENKGNFEKVENTLVKDHNLEHPLAEPANQEQVQSLTVISNIIDARSPLAKPKKKLRIQQLEAIPLMFSIRWINLVIGRMLSLL